MITCEQLCGWLRTCPEVEQVTVDALGPGPGLGVFPQGIVRVRKDILGGSRVQQKFLLRRHGSPGDGWQERFMLWFLSAQPIPGTAIQLEGGKLTQPTTDGWGTWEMTLTVDER